MCDENRFQEYIDSENSDFLLEIYPQILKNGNSNEISELKEAFSNIISIWKLDIESKKATINNSDYIHILKVIEKIDGNVDYIERGVYYRYKTEYAFEQKDYKKGLYYANKSKKYFYKYIKLSPNSEVGYRALYYLYNTLYDNIINKEYYLQKALKTLNDGIKTSNSDFLFFEKWRFFRLYSFENLSQKFRVKIFKDRESFIKILIEKSVKDSEFAFEIASLYVKTLYYSDKILNNNENIVLLELFLKLAITITSNSVHKITDYGHIYYKAGEKLLNLEFLNKAKDLFTQAIATKKHHSLHYVYFADTLLKIAEIDKLNGDFKKYKKLNNSVKNLYLKYTDIYENDISYLIHASEYFFKYYYFFKTDKQKIDWIKKIYPTLIQTEKTGKGYYWSPYLHLVLANCYINNISEAKVWLKRAVLKLTILIDDKLENLQSFFYENGYDEMEIFNKKLIQKLKNIEPRYYDGGERYENLSLITIDNVEEGLF
ncbi:hypothetical protein JXR93_14000 [bacterium]|nr:hypothetical protein [bacterium]